MEDNFKEALWRIEEAKANNRYSLDLSSLALKKLPKEIGQLSILTSLWLNGNQLTSIPKEIGQLVALTKLSLENNQLISVPKE